MPVRLVLCDRFLPIVRAWEREFSAYPEVEIRMGDLLEVEAEAYVSPANSFGDMGGGIDRVLRDRFGGQIQDTVQAAIAAMGGKLPIGQAIVVETRDGHVPYLLVAPTMEFPCRVAHSRNAYHATLAMLWAWHRWELSRPGEIKTVAAPGMCTGIGGMDPMVAAIQMREAYAEFVTALQLS